MTTSDQPHSPPSEFASVFGYLYAQLAVLLVGFALFVLIANLTSLSLYGVIGDAHEVWVHNVRPLVAYPLGLLNAQLPTAWQLGMPTLLIDYVAVGITMVLWWLRSLPVVAIEEAPGALLFVLLFIFLWPAHFFIAPQVKIYVGTARGNREVGWLEWVPPLIYLGLILIANFVLV